MYQYIVFDLDMTILNFTYQIQQGKQDFSGTFQGDGQHLSYHLEEKDIKTSKIGRAHV